MNNSTNNTLHDLDYWFEIVGEKWLVEILYTYSIIPLCLITIGLNLLAYSILNKIQFNKSSFYSYMRVYSLNSICLSLVLMTTFIPATKRLFAFTRLYASVFYGCYFYTPTLSTLYLNASFLEICVVVERALYFLPSKYKKIKVMGLKKFCFILLLVSLIISSPNYLIFYPTYLDINNSTRIYYWTSSAFSATLIGKLSLFSMFIFRDILTLVVKIFLNIKMVYLVKNYLKRLSIEKKLFVQKISMPILHNQICLSNNQDKITYLSKTDKNQTYIAIMMCIFSLFEHLFYISAYILYFFQLEDIAAMVYYLALISLTFKHSSNFIILYKFNSLFRSQLKKKIL